MKKILFIGLFALLNVLSARAYDFEVDGIYYRIISNTASQVEVTDKEQYRSSYFDSVVIPATVTHNGTTYSVTSIGKSAFWQCTGLTSVTIPDGVTSIGDGAFCYCARLTSVVIPESVVYVGSSVFWSTAIRNPLYNSKIFAYMPKDYSGEYTVPDGIHTIAGSGFSGCKGLTSVVIPGSVTSIGDGVFGGCTGLTSVVIPESVTSIGEYAFRGCTGLTSVVIHEGVTSIGRGAFSGCTGLTSVEWNAKNCEEAPRLWDNSLKSITFGDKVEYIPRELCCECTSLESVTISEGVTSIGAFAFCWCSGLTSVTIPESVNAIGTQAFWGIAISSPLYNSKVFAYMPEGYSREYAIPEGIQTIAGGAFKGGVTSMTVPESVNAVGHIPFGFGEDLVSVTILAKTPPTCDYYGLWSDDGCFETVTLYVPRDSKSAYQSSSEWRKFKNIKGITGLVTVGANDEFMGVVTGGGEYKSNEKATLTAIPNEGYHFVKWDDGNTANPRILTVTGDITLTAIFAKNAPTANESALTAAPIAYVQGRTAYLADGLGEVEAFTATGQRVYRGTARTVTLPRPGIYVLRVVADGRRCKVVVK